MSRSLRKTSAFTLVELLVVITIIGLLMGLLLPAVNAARESGRSSQCKNNLKQIGLAAQSHVATRGYFPSSGWGANYTGDPSAGFDPNYQPGGWIYVILPYMGMDAIHDFGKSSTGTTDPNALASIRGTTMPLLICPTRRSPTAKYSAASGGVATTKNATSPATYLAKTDYAACAGSNLTTPPPSGDPSTTAADPKDNGVSYRLSRVRPQDITDGLSQTIFASEKYMNNNNPRGSYMSGSAQSDNNSAFDGFGSQLNRWVPYPGNGSTLQNTQPAADGMSWAAQQNPPQSDDPSYRFGSNHPTGMNTVFCDGSVTMISFGINPNAFGGLGMRNAVDLIPGYIITEAPHN